MPELAPAAPEPAPPTPSKAPASTPAKPKAYATPGFQPASRDSNPRASAAVTLIAKALTDRRTFESRAVWQARSQVGRLRRHQCKDSVGSA